MEQDMRYYVEISSDVMLRNLKNRTRLTQELCGLYRKAEKRDICIIASGSSLNGALAAKSFLRQFAGCRVLVMSPTEYVDYRREEVRDYFPIVISQSGCSTNIMAAVKVMREDGLTVTALTGNLEGDLMKAADRLIEYGVGGEAVEYVTLGVSALIEYLVMFGMEAGRINGALTKASFDQILEELKTCCTANAQMYRNASRFTAMYRQDLLDMTKAVIVGDGASMGIAREAALKFGETLKIPALYCESEEYIHGPDMQLTPEYAVFFIDTNPNHNRMHEIYEATKLVTKHAYMITNKKISREDTVLCAENTVRNELTPLFTIVPFQYIAAVVTKEKNDFKCHPLFKRFEERIHCKTAGYEAAMKMKADRHEEGV